MFERYGISDFQSLRILVLFGRSPSICSYNCKSKAPFIRRKVFPGKRVTLLAESTLPSVYMRKKLTPLPEPRANFPITTERMLWSSLLDRVDPGRRAKVFIWRKVGPARRVTPLSQKGNPARRVTLLAEPTFCFSGKRFAKFFKEMYEKLARPG